MEINTTFFWRCNLKRKKPGNGINANFFPIAKKDESALKHACFDMRDF